jgi:hypothetical protein
MSFFVLKYLIVFLFGLFCISLCAGKCSAQSVGGNNLNGINDSIIPGKDSLRKKTVLTRNKIKQHAKITVGNNFSQEKKDAARISSDVNTVKSNSRKKKQKKSSKDVKEGNQRSTITDTLSKDPLQLERRDQTVKKRTQHKTEVLSKTVSDTLNKDSLKGKVSNLFSKEKIEHTIKSTVPIADYKLDKEPLKQKSIFSTKRKRDNFIDSKKKTLSNSASKMGHSIKKNIDSTKHISVRDVVKQQLKNNLKGSLSVGYEYGILPYAAPDNYPCGSFKSEGRLSFLILNLPLELSYRYTTIKSVIGINNYFRVSYDASRYKEELEKKTAVRERLKKINLDTLESVKQKIAMKMEYARMVGNIELPAFSLPDTSLNTKLPFKLADSLHLDSTRALSYLKKKDEYLRKKDSILRMKNEYMAMYDQYKTKYDSLTEVIHTLKNTGDLKDFNVQDKIKTNSGLSKTESILKNIKKFEIGLCNPSYSLFLVSNAPLKGINFEYQSKTHFFAVTYGTTVNTLFFNPNTLQGKIQGARNFYNYFDFNSLSNGRKILVLKGGQGQKEGTHFFVGLLIGKGKMDYLTLTDPKYGKKESNVVAEIDGKYKFNESLNAEIILGKSSLQSEDLSINQLKKSFAELWSPYRSNALQAKINYDISQTKTKIQLTGRLIDPYFKSFGVSFLRSDNIRYEAKVDQVITKNIKYSIAYRREEDNLLGLINYKNTFTTIQNSLSIRFKKGLSLRLNYAPLIRTLRNGDELKKDNNSISTAVLAYVPKMKHVQANYSILYSKYRVTSDSGNIHFDNLTYSHQFQFENGFKTGANVSWFENTLKDTVNNNTYLGVVDIGYITKEQNSFTIGGKTAYKPGIPMEFGFLAKVTLKVYKTIFWEAEAEKIIIGDYYSSWINAKIKRFPYYLSSKVIINF